MVCDGGRSDCSTHHEGLQGRVLGDAVVVGGADLREVEAAMRPVLAVQRQIGPVDQHAEGAVSIQPLRGSSGHVSVQRSSTAADQLRSSEDGQVAARAQNEM